MLSSILNPIKRRLRPWVHKARHLYSHYFLRFSKEDLAAELAHLGIVRGDLIMVHISFDQFRGFTGNLGDVIRALQSAVGETGTVAMPTLPFSGTAIDYVRSGQITDVAKTPSRMGLITEVFRRLPGVKRSVHPTHPVAAYGAKADELVRDSHLAQTPCGKGTPFFKLLELNGKIVLMGTDIRSMTFFHAVEEILEPEMPFSPFTSEWFNLQTRDLNGQIVASKMRLFDPAISRARDVGLLAPALKRSRFGKEGRVGGLSIIALDAREVLETCRDLAKKGEFCYRKA
jgi:aminoglycoside 3-N-acetyltransferase